MCRGNLGSGLGQLLLLFGDLGLSFGGGAAPKTGAVTDDFVDARLTPMWKAMREYGVSPEAFGPHGAY